MRKATTIWPGALAVLACAASASAHHSGSMYVATATWIKGTVVRFEHLSPHSITTIEERAARGRTSSPLGRRRPARPRAGSPGIRCGHAQGR